jgi:mRNA interferase RelE/StbE
MSYDVRLLEEVEEDLARLDDEVLKEVFAYFEKYETDPYRYSQKLSDRFGLDLKDYRKTYLFNAAYRIVIKIEERNVKVVEVIAVGERDGMSVYKTAYKRISRSDV